MVSGEEDLTPRQKGAEPWLKALIERWRTRAVLIEKGTKVYKWSSSSLSLHNDFIACCHGFEKNV